jgi:hypothetical protein
VGILVINGCPTGTGFYTPLRALGQETFANKNETFANKKQAEQAKDGGLVK